MGNSDILRNSDVWKRYRTRGVARDWELQGQKHVTHMLGLTEPEEAPFEVNNQRFEVNDDGTPFEGHNLSELLRGSYTT